MTTATGTTRPLTLPEREHTAARLLQASEKHSFDPIVDVDWDAPLAEDMPFAPLHRSSLYGTAMWNGMSAGQRIELTKHEVASIASVGIWFESVLMQMLIRHTYDRDPTSGHVQYALTEIADECRHSVMFARMIEKLGCPAYGPGRTAHALGRFFKATSTGPLTFGATLYVEALLDTLQREAMDDPAVQPLVRTVSKIHVVEESRHIRYASEELARQCERLSAPARACMKIALAVSATLATANLIHPRVYAAVGLDPATARREAARNPHWRATKAWMARKVVAEFDRIGLIDGPARAVWSRARLLG